MNAELSAARTGDGGFRIRVTGDWQLSRRVPSTAEAERAITSGAGPVSFEAGDLGRWDSSLLTALVDICEVCRARGVAVDRTGLPTGVQRLLALAEAVPEKQGARRAVERPGLLERIGVATARAVDASAELLNFVGRAAIALAEMRPGRVAFRVSDLLLIIQRSGGEALGIVSRINFLVGVILAFVGAEPLDRNVQGVLAANLARLLGNAEIVPYPSFTDASIDRQISIAIFRFEADEHDTVILDARWTIQHPAEKASAGDAHDSHIVQQAADGSTASTVAAMSQAVGALSQQVAAALH